MTQTWTQSIQPYFSRHMLRVAVLGFSSGLPALLILSTLSYWLAQEGISCESIGAIAFATAPYSLKFLFAPFTDHITLPVLTKNFGRRRGWLLCTQFFLALSILGLGWSDPKHHLWLSAVMCFMVTIGSSLQDIIIDAYRIETIENKLQPVGGIVVTFGYRIAMLISGAGAVALSDYTTWKIVYTIMAFLMVIGMGATLLSPEPPQENSKNQPIRTPGWILQSFWAPLKDFTHHTHWILLLILIFCYQASDHLMSRMTMVFYNDLGFTGSEIAYASKIGGIWVILLGVISAGILTVRYKLLTVLIWGACLHAGTNIILSILAFKGHSLPWLYAAVISENFTFGIIAAAFVGLLSSICNAKFSMTQYAFFSSIAALSRIILQGLSGILAPLVSWPHFFQICALSSLPGIMIILYLKNQPTFGASAAK